MDSTDTSLRDEHLQSTCMSMHIIIIIIKSKSVQSRSNGGLGWSGRLDSMGSGQYCMHNMYMQNSLTPTSLAKLF